LAREVFAHPYFYQDRKEAKEHDSRRSSVLGNRTVREVFRECFGEHGLEATESLARSIRARALRIRNFYYRGEAAATRQAFAADAIESRLGCEFDVAVLPVATISEALLPLLPVEANGVDHKADNASTDRRTIDMSFLGPLRAPGKERFLVPDKIYVRDCMRRVFSLFHEDAVQVPRRKPSNAYSAALVGSPGVGTSILLFLAALDQACVSNVVYYRKSSEDPLAVFVMTPSSDGQSVRIWFTRKMASASLGRGLSTAAIALEDCLIVQRNDVYCFVDGPKYGDRSNTLDGNYDYVCPSSDGLLRYRNEEYDKRLWVLDGWTEQEAVTALVALHKQPLVTAQHAYFLCGGVIGDVMQACSSYTYVKRQLDELVDQCDKGSFELVVGGTVGRGSDPSNPDRLRTMFELTSIERRPFRQKKRMAAYHVVDSPYLIDKLYAALPPKAWQDSYDQIMWWTHLGRDVGPVLERLFSRTPFLD
jgi:hypothetical protein